MASRSRNVRHRSLDCWWFERITCSQNLRLLGGDSDRLSKLPGGFTISSLLGWPRTIQRLYGTSISLEFYTLKTYMITVRPWFHTFSINHPSLRTSFADYTVFSNSGHFAGEVTRYLGRLPSSDLYSMAIANGPSLNSESNPNICTSTLTRHRVSIDYDDRSGRGWQA